MKKIPQPWDFIAANQQNRYNTPVGAGKYYGSGRKNNQGYIRSSSVVRPPQDKVAGFKKPITQA